MSNDHPGLPGSRSECLAVLRAIRPGHCLYRGSRPCDCKYSRGEPLSKMGETTGCPELRTLIMLLDRMTDEQFAEMTKTKWTP